MRQKHNAFTKLVAISTLIIALVILGLRVGLDRQAKVLRFSGLEREYTRQESILSSDEEAELLKAIPHVINWIIDWSSSKEVCPDGENIALANQIRNTSSKRLMAKIELTKRNIYVTIDSLHHRFVFGRTQIGRIYLEDYSSYCESSYIEHVKKHEFSSKNALQPLRDMLEKLPKPKGDLQNESLQNEIITYQQDKYIDVPALISKTKYDAETKTEQELTKTFLHRKALNLVSSDTRISCEEGQTIRLVIPEFSLNDPGIYALLQERPGYFNVSGQSIVYFSFAKRYSDAKIDISNVKRISSDEEVNFFSSRITQRPSRTFITRCTSLDK